MLRQNYDVPPATSAAVALAMAEAQHLAAVVTNNDLGDAGAHRRATGLPRNNPWNSLVFNNRVLGEKRRFRASIGCFLSLVSGARRCPPQKDGCGRTFRRHKDARRGGQGLAVG